jgi:hypothetical protein
MSFLSTASSRIHAAFISLAYSESRDSTRTRRRMTMTTMTVKPSTRTHSAISRIEELAASPLVEEVLAWMALVGFAVICYLVFALAVWA